MKFSHNITNSKKYYNTKRKEILSGEHLPYARLISHTVFLFYYEKERKSIMKTKGTLILLLAALIWGMAFVAQSSAANNIGSFTFNAARSSHKRVAWSTSAETEHIV